MEHESKAFKVSLQKDGFCIVTGPQDSGILYSCGTGPFAPLLLENSPVVIHLYCPELFPDEILKLHAEHLGHFLCMQHVPEVNVDYERTLFANLCDVFGRDTIMSVYTDSLLGNDTLRERVLCLTRGDRDTPGSYPTIFVDTKKHDVKDTVSLLRNLLALFSLNDLRDCEFSHVPGKEPLHMLFLYLIQLLALYVSSFLKDVDLALILAVASAPFLEHSFCDPLCASTLLKPIFVPYYEPKDPRKVKKTSEAQDQDGPNPEARLRGYRLFEGYRLDANGSFASFGMSDLELSWNEHSLLQRIQGCHIIEQKFRTFWFVSPQMGDRTVMVREYNPKLKNRNRDDKIQWIQSYLVSDNVMAYMQSAVFGTIRNMMPCHANSEFNENTMKVIDGSMQRMVQAICSQHKHLMVGLEKAKSNCLNCTGVGISWQERGDALYFGNVFTGDEEKRPVKTSNPKMGVFTCVNLAVSQSSMLKRMLSMATGRQPTEQLRELLSKRFRLPDMLYTSKDFYLYACYPHRFNTGEFTEVACVKPKCDPTYRDTVHEEKLTDTSKYQLTLSQAALPMCVVTLTMTVRQTVIMIMGFFCSELARVIYSQRAVNHVLLCKQIISLQTTGKFRPRKDEDYTNSLQAQYGNLLKVRPQCFGTPGRQDCNFHDLDRMEWLQPENTNFPEYIRKSLNAIGSTKAEVLRIMRETNVSYNRILFTNPDGRDIPFAWMFANQQYLTQAPLMIPSSLRVFSSNTNSYGSVKMSKLNTGDCFYRVKVFSNMCVDTDMFLVHKNSGISSPINSTPTVAEIVELIRTEVSPVLPKIHVDRITMMYPNLKKAERELLFSKLREADIEVLGSEDACSSNLISRPGSSHSSGFLLNDDEKFVNHKKMTRKTEEGEHVSKRVKVDDELTICYESDSDSEDILGAGGSFRLQPHQDRERSNTNDDRKNSQSLCVESTHSTKVQHHSDRQESTNSLIVDDSDYEFECAQRLY